MNKVTAISLVSCCAALLAGCQKQDPLVGKWNGTNTIGVVEQSLTLTVNADGTYKEVIVSGRPKLARKLVSSDTGTWKKLSEGKYYFKLTDTNWTNEGATPAQEARMKERFNARKSQIIASANSEPYTDISWDGNDKFILHEGKVTETFIRSQ